MIWRTAAAILFVVQRRQQLGVAEDDSQRVVQLVGHAGHQLAQRGQFRRLDELCLGRSQGLVGGAQLLVLARQRRERLGACDFGGANAQQRTARASSSSL